VCRSTMPKGNTSPWCAGHSRREQGHRPPSGSDTRGDAYHASSPWGGCREWLSADCHVAGPPLVPTHSARELPPEALCRSGRCRIRLSRLACGVVGRSLVTTRPPACPARSSRRSIERFENPQPKTGQPNYAHHKLFTFHLSRRRHSANPCWLFSLGRHLCGAGHAESVRRHP